MRDGRKARKKLKKDEEKAMKETIGEGRKMIRRRPIVSEKRKGKHTRRKLRGRDNR